MFIHHFYVSVYLFLLLHKSFTTNGTNLVSLVNEFYNVVMNFFVRILQIMWTLIITPSCFVGMHAPSVTIPKQQWTWVSLQMYTNTCATYWLTLLNLILKRLSVEVANVLPIHFDPQQSPSDQNSATYKEIICPQRYSKPALWQDRTLWGPYTSWNIFSQQQNNVKNNKFDNNWQCIHNHQRIEITTSTQFFFASVSVTLSFSPLIESQIWSMSYNECNIGCYMHFADSNDFKIVLQLQHYILLSLNVI